MTRAGGQPDKPRKSLARSAFGGTGDAEEKEKNTAQNKKEFYHESTKV